MSPAPPRIAVVTHNTLMGVGLRTILEKIIPMAEVQCYDSFERFEADAPGSCFHYFVDEAVCNGHRDFFEAHSHKTLLLTAGEAGVGQEPFRSIRIGGTEEELVREILRLHHAAHRHGHPGAVHPAAPSLSPREAEVLALVVKGLINKEIADRLEIGLTTVITHRRNIMEKLGIRSVSGLTIYAVMHGYVNIEEI